MKKDLIQKAEEYAQAYSNCKEAVKLAWLAGYDTGQRSKSRKKELDLSFIPADFLPILERWVKYKQERKQAYTQSGIEACYHKLLELSNTSPATAMAVIEQSIANNWAGLFELKNGTGIQLSQTVEQSPGSRRESVNNLAELSRGILQGLAGKKD
ncbi:hypothetical protein [Bacteroides nordii]|jgi:hypothetical protein|uniref:hypothetical protein n=1 Tax=Bacteroides nordii TaxID=291645 RepID=UPI001E57D9A2|nr:hypothetical protein [Bacteroides nordii]